MPGQNSILDRVQIPSPCSAEWDEMTGNDQARFCQHCSKHVNNLSEMTRKRALELVSRSKGQLCVRYYRRPDGKIQTAEGDSRLYQIRRRAGHLAAGAFTAVLSLSSGVAAQTQTSAEQTAASQMEATVARDDAPPTATGVSTTGTLIVTAFDPALAVIPGVNVTLVQEGTGHEQKATTDSEGQYRFQNLGAGTYTCKFESEGFETTEIKEIVLKAGDEVKLNVNIGVKAEYVTMGIVTVIIPDDPLVKAASENDLKTVKQLIAVGSDVNKRDESTDSTALDEAVRCANREMVRALLDAGAEVNARGSRRQTALMMLDDDATPALVWDLVAAGAKVNLKDEDGDTALVLSAGWSGPEVLRALLAAGAKVDARNKEGETALMNAAERGSLENVKLLIAYGAKVNRKNSEGETALKLADDNEQEEVVELLKAHDAIE